MFLKFWLLWHLGLITANALLDKKVSAVIKDELSKEVAKLGVADKDDLVTLLLKDMTETDTRKQYHKNEQLTSNTDDELLRLLTSATSKTIDDTKAKVEAAQTKKYLDESEKEAINERKTDDELLRLLASATSKAIDDTKSKVQTAQAEMHSKDLKKDTIVETTREDELLRLLADAVSRSIDDTKKKVLQAQTEKYLDEARKEAINERTRDDELLRLLASATSTSKDEKKDEIQTAQTKKYLEGAKKDTINKKPREDELLRLLSNAVSRSIDDTKKKVERAQTEKYLEESRKEAINERTRDDELLRLLASSTSTSKDEKKEKIQTDDELLRLLVSATSTSKDDKKEEIQTAQTEKHSEGSKKDTIDDELLRLLASATSTSKDHKKEAIQAAQSEKYLKESRKEAINERTGDDELLRLLASATSTTKDDKKEEIQTAQTEKHPEESKKDTIDNQLLRLLASTTSTSKVDKKDTIQADTDKELMRGILDAFQSNKRRSENEELVKALLRNKKEIQKREKLQGLDDLDLDLHTLSKKKIDATKAILETYETNEQKKEDECRDEYDGCYEYLGYCESHKESLAKKCRKSCKLCRSCEDVWSTEICKKFESHNYCQSDVYKDKLKDVCYKTCGHCRVPSPPACQMHPDGCCWDKVSFAKDGCPACEDNHIIGKICKTFRDDCNNTGNPGMYMKKNCPVSCGFCDPHKEHTHYHKGHPCESYKPIVCEDNVRVRKKCKTLRNLCNSTGNPGKYMRKNCPASCGLCDPNKEQNQKGHPCETYKHVESCKDLSGYDVCRRWRQSNTCGLFKDLAEKWCFKTCFNCHHNHRPLKTVVQASNV